MAAPIGRNCDDVGQCEALPAELRSAWTGEGARPHIVIANA